MKAGFSERHTNRTAGSCSLVKLDVCNGMKMQLVFAAGGCQRTLGYVY